MITKPNGVKLTEEKVKYKITIREQKQEMQERSLIIKVVLFIIDGCRSIFRKYCGNRF